MDEEGIQSRFLAALFHLHVQRYMILKKNKENKLLESSIITVQLQHHITRFLVSKFLEIHFEFTCSQSRTY